MKNNVMLFEQFTDYEATKEVIPDIVADVFSSKEEELEGEAEEDEYGTLIYVGELSKEYPAGNGFLPYGFTIFFNIRAGWGHNVEQGSGNYPGDDSSEFVGATASDIELLPDDGRDEPIGYPDDVDIK